MDFKKIVDQVKDTAEDLKQKAQAKVKEAGISLDKDQDGVPDAVEGMANRARTLASQAQEKAKGLAQKAEEKLKS